MKYENNVRLRIAARAIQTGKVVAYPTEAVWGLGCDPFNTHAVRRILSLKKRDPAKGLILVAADMAQLEFLLADLPAQQRATLAASWPGPVTWLIPHQGKLPAVVTGMHDSVAVRVSAHPVVRALCQWVGGVIVSTSANPQGLAPARWGYRARRYFGQSVIYAPGQVDLQARPSTIRDLSSGHTLRS